MRTIMGRAACPLWEKAINLGTRGAQKWEDNLSKIIIVAKQSTNSGYCLTVYIGLPRTLNTRDILIDV